MDIYAFCFTYIYTVRICKETKIEDVLGFEIVLDVVFREPVKL